MWFAPGADAQRVHPVHASVDRTTVGENEILTLTLQTSDNDASEPDVSALDVDFDVLSSNQSTSVRIINGQRSDRRLWRFRLSPKRTGELMIPSLDIGGGLTNPIPITVTSTSTSTSDPAADEDGPFFMEVEATPPRPYVQSQITFTVKFYRRLGEPILDASMEPPSANDVLVHTLGNDLSYESRLPSGRYRVTERRYGLFPQQSGSLTIRSPTVVLRHGRRFNAPQRQVSGDDITLTVAPRPANRGPGPWLPAQSLELREAWSPEPPSFRVGQPITRSVTVLARGLLGTQLPTLAIAPLDNFTVYPEPPQIDTAGQAEFVLGRSVQTAAIIPRRPGRLLLPALTVRWWNTETDQWANASLPARQITVEPAASTPANAASNPTPNLAPSDDASDHSARGGGVGLERDPLANRWMWATLGVTLLWLATLALWWRERGRGTNATRDPSLTKPGKFSTAATFAPLAPKRLHEADSPRALGAVVLEWARKRWPGQPMHNLFAVAKSVDETTTADALRALDRAIYRPSDAWPRQRIVDALEAELSASPSATAAPAPDLRPLYPE